MAFAYDIYCNPQKTTECSAQRFPCSMQSLLFRRAYLVAPVGRREAEFLRDAMAALPRKSDSDGLRLVSYASESAADFHAVVIKADPYPGKEGCSCAFSFERNVWKDGQEQFGNALLLARYGYGFSSFAKDRTSGGSRCEIPSTNARWEGTARCSSLVNRGVE